MPKTKIFHFYAKTAQKIFFIFFIINYSILIANCEAQSITFQKAVIGPNVDYLRSVVQTADNGYIAVGRFRENFPNDFTYIIRFNELGDTLWTKKINREEAICVIKTNDNNFALCGISGSFVKFDINGNILKIGSYFNSNLSIKKLLQVNDNSYFLCGSIITTNIFPYLSKYDQNGNFMWDTIYTLNGYYGAFADFVISDDNNIVLTGVYKQTLSGSYVILLMKINQQGNQIWFISNNSFYYPLVSSITKTSSNAFIIGGNLDCAYMAKFNDMGIFQWLKMYDTVFSSIAYSITTAHDGGYIYTGFIDTGSGPDKVRVRKTDSNGIEIWQKLYGFENNSESAWDIKTTSDSGFVIVGRTDFQLDDAYILKIDKNGELFPIGIQVISEEIPNSFNLYQNFPNPFNPITTIEFDIYQKSSVTLKVYDVNGREIKKIFEDNLKAGTYEITYNAADLASGVYYYRLFIDNYIETKKMVLLK